MQGLFLNKWSVESILNKYEIGWCFRTRKSRLNVLEFTSLGGGGLGERKKFLNWNIKYLLKKKGGEVIRTNTSQSFSNRCEQVSNSVEISPRQRVER